MISTASPARAARVLAIAIAAVLAAAVATPLRFGWEDLAPDDATYLYVGRSVLEGNLPTDPLGRFYAARSPLYPVVLAAADVASPGDVLGPRLVVWGLAIGGLVGTILLARRLAGVPAALGTAAALGATPAIWLTLPSLRIDLPLAAGVVATVAALFRPTTRRFVLAGLAAGAVILLKETAVLLVLAPLAWWGALEPRRWVRLAARYLGAAAAVAAWWWVLVWIREGAIVPLWGAQRSGGETFPRTFTFEPAAWALVGLLSLGWAVFTIRHRSDPRARVVAVAGGALAVPAAVAWHHQLALRQFVPLAVLSCLALGTVGGPLVARAIATGTWRRGVAIVACVATAVAVSVSQARLEPLHRRPSLAAATAAWLEPRLEPGTVVAMNRLSRSELAYRLYGRASVAVANYTSSDLDAVGDPDAYVWLGVFNGRLHGLERSELREVLTEPDVRFLVLFAPHRTAPWPLGEALSRPGLPGIELVTTLRRDDQQALVFAVDPTQAGRAVDALPTTVTAETSERLRT